MPHPSAHYFTYPMPPGPLTIGATEAGVSAVVAGAIELAGQHKSSALTNTLATQLQEYFAGKRTSFDVPLDVEGTAFQKAVWEAVLSIPYGEVRTSSQVAQAIGKPDAHRSVGAALAKNPCAIIIPAHRVVGANGRALGTGPDADLKQGLLALEARYCADSRP